MLCPYCGRDNSSDAQFCNECGSKLDSPRNGLPSPAEKSEPSAGRADFQSQPGQITSPGGTFVGRQRELGELKAALDDALSGQGRLVMLAGEPGIAPVVAAPGIKKFVMGAPPSLTRPNSPSAKGRNPGGQGG